jgi:hypothetical protein
VIVGFSSFIKLSFELIDIESAYILLYALFRRGAHYATGNTANDLYSRITEQFDKGTSS